MSFWPFLWKKPQIYSGYAAGFHFPRFSGSWSFSAVPQGTKYSQWVDNEQDWISVHWRYAIRSDGTLWQVFPVASYFSQPYSAQDIAGISLDQGPYQIGTDTDWKSICYPFLLKEDGSLWVIDSVAGLGILPKQDNFMGHLETVPGSSNPGGAAFRAVVSSPIESASVTGYGLFSKKPTLSIQARIASDGTAGVNFESPSAGVSGNGCELNAIWKAWITGVSVTSSGSGYTSPPSVRLSPQGDDEDDGAVLWAVMNKTATKSFRVTSPGEGYTYATASDPVTGATATAVIEDGKITSWQVTSSGTALRDITSNPFSQSTPQETTATISGDGAGASAICEAFPSSVSSIKFGNYQQWQSPNNFLVEGNPACWTQPPLIEISGGGGNGAQATVSSLVGRISRIEVLSPGDGYTQGYFYRLVVVATPASGDSVGATGIAGYVTLSGGPVIRVDGTQTGFGDANPGSTGEVKPFSLVTYRSVGWGYGLGFPSYNSLVDLRCSRAELVGSAGYTVPLGIQEDGTVSLSSAVSGFGETPPIIRVYYSPRLDSTPTFYESVLFSEGCNGFSHFPGSLGPCPNGKTIKKLSHVGISSYSNALGIYGFKSLKITGPLGATAEYGGVDGWATQKSLSLNGPEDFFWGCKQPLPQYGTGLTLPASVEYELFDREVMCDDRPLPAGVFTPASQPEVAEVHFVLRKSPGTNWTYDDGVFGERPGRGVSSPELLSNGKYGFRSVSVMDTGTKFRREPALFFCTSHRPYPTRVGDETWNSICHSTGVTLGVTSSGEAKWWSNLGSGNIYGRGRFSKPTPIGRGAKLVTSTESFPLPGNAQLIWSRVAIDRPSYGPFPCWNWNYVPIVATSVSPLGYNSQYDFTFSTASTATVPFLGKHEYSTECFGVLPHYVGIGYTEPPNVTYLGDPILELSTELVGPESFTKCQGGLLFDGNDNAWDPMYESFWSGSPVTEYSGTDRTADPYLYLYDFLNPGIEHAFVRESSHSVKSYQYASYISLVRVGNKNTQDASLVMSWQQPTADSSLQQKAGDKKYLCSGYSAETIATYFSKSGTSDKSSGPVSVQLNPDGRLRWGEIYSMSMQSSLTVPTTTSQGDVSVTLALADSPSPMLKYEGVVAASLSGLVSLSDGSVGIRGATFREQTWAPSITVDPVLQGIDSFGEFYGPGYYTGNYTARKSSVGQIYSFFTGNLTNTTPLPYIPHIGQLSVSLQSTGDGYTEPPVVKASQPPRTAVVSSRIDGKVVAAVAVHRGSGFTSPPLLTVTANDDFGGGAQLKAIIEGPVYDVTVSSKGSGYRCPPEPKFSLNGIPAFGEAECSGQIDEILIASPGGGYREPPEITITGTGEGAVAVASISGYVDSASVLDPGEGYTSTPSVSFSGGGGNGAEAVAILSGGAGGKYRVSRIIITAGGSGYSSAPTVSISGGGGSGALGVCAINAAITEVSLTNKGTGYAPGASASVSSGSALLGVRLAMGVDSVEVGSGGLYRNTPTVSFLPMGHIESISLSSGGSGYSSPPLVGVVGPCGKNAKASCSISGTVSEVVVSKAGSGYTNPPIVELVGGYDPVGGSPAKAHAVCSSGCVQSIVIDDPGSGYFEPPNVSIGRYFEAKLKCNVDGGKITSVDVVSGGYGYVSPPSVTFTGGKGAEFVASVQGGAVASVSVTSQGSGYTKDSKAVIDSGIGIGATAAAKISASVSSVSLTDCGQGFELNEPVKVFFSGGGGTGASATAVISSSGSGASATARIDGSIVAVKVTSPGGNYQTSPSVSVNLSNNFLAGSEDWSPPYIQARIQGAINGLTIENPGDGYGDTIQGSNDRAKTTADAPWARTPARTQVVGTRLYAGGPITSTSFAEVNLYHEMRGDQHFSPPEMAFDNSVTMKCSISCRRGPYSVKAGQGPKKGPYAGNAEYWRYTGKLVDTINYASVKQYAGRTQSSIRLGSGAGESVQQGDGLAIATLPLFEELPEVFIVDVAGEGGDVEMTSQDSLFVTSAGSGYTNVSGLYLRGGVPESWGTPPSVSFSFDSQSGEVTSGEVSGNPANFYYTYSNQNYFADVYLDGGGGEIGSILAAGKIVLNPGTGAFVFEPAADLPSRKFSSSPTAVIVSMETPAHRGPDANNWLINVSDSISRYAVSNVSLAIDDVDVEAFLFGDIRGGTYNDFFGYPESISSLRQEEWGDALNTWVVFPHFYDGWVDYVWIDQYRESARLDVLVSAPSISFSLGGGGTGASATTSLLEWSDVYSGGGVLFAAKSQT